MKLKRFYGRLFTVGLVFLFNPVIKLVDILPDFVGALCIATAISELAMLDERLENARRLMFYLAGISGVRSFLMLFMYSMNDNDILAAVSFLGALELFVFIYFAVCFFGGISYIAQRSESNSVLADVDRIRRLWVWFFVLHTAATVIPQLSALPRLLLMSDPDNIPWLTEGRLTLYQNYLVLILGTASLAVGIWWLKETASFFGRVKRDTAFKGSLQARYGQFLEANPLHSLFLDVRFAAICFVIGCALQIGFSVGGAFTLPAWVGTALFALAAVRLLGVKNSFVWIFILLMGGIQAVAFHLLKGIPAAVLLAVASFGAVYFTENAFASRVSAAIDWDISVYYIFTRLFCGAFLVLTAVYSVIGNYWLHLARLLCFGAWIAVAVWFSSSVMGEIKLRRRL